MQQQRKKIQPSKCAELVNGTEHNDVLIKYMTDPANAA